MDPVKQQARHVSWSHRRTQRYTANKIMREWLNSILRNPLVPIHFASPDASNNICNDDPYISLDGNVYCIHARRVSLPNSSFDSRIKKRGNRREEPHLVSRDEAVCGLGNETRLFFFLSVPLKRYVEPFQL